MVSSQNTVSGTKTGKPKRSCYHAFPKSGIISFEMLWPAGARRFHSSARTVRSVERYAREIGIRVRWEITSASASSPPEAPPLRTTSPTPSPTKRYLCEKYYSSSRRATPLQNPKNKRSKKQNIKRASGRSGGNRS